VVLREIRTDKGLQCEHDRSPRFIPPPSEAGIAAAPASAVEEVKSQAKIRSVKALGGTAFSVQGSVDSSDEDCKQERLVRLVGWKRMSFRGTRHFTPPQRRDRLRPGPLHPLLARPDSAKHYRIKVRRSFREDGSLECEPDVKRFAWRRH
jgi:hypothetical protein